MIPGPELDGKYEIVRKIREGGMGAVYEVRHRLLDERRVVKVLHPHLIASAELAERFRREARAASGLRHPNIAHLHDFAVDADGRAYIVMELIEGLGLDEIVRTQGPPPLGLGLEISRQALRAVGFLHRRGFVHRDISPDNLMLTRDPDGAPLVKLLDLGIAKGLMEEADHRLTSAGMFLGKPRYASPEQLGTEEAVDGRSDLYSLGVVLYELLTGSCPIQGDSASSLLASHLFHPPLDFAVSDPAGRLPPDLRDLLLRALAKKPEERFANAAEMGERLGEVQARFPWTPADLDRVLEHRNLDSTMILPSRPGSTQERLDRQFQGVTPSAAPVSPIAAVVPLSSLEVTERLEPGLATSTVPIPVAAPTPPPVSVAAPTPPVRQAAPPPTPPPIPHPLAPSPTTPPALPGRGGISSSAPPPPGMVRAPRLRRGRAGWLVAAAALLLLAGLMFWLFPRGGDSEDQVVAVSTEEPAADRQAPAPAPVVETVAPAQPSPSPATEPLPVPSTEPASLEEIPEATPEEIPREVAAAPQPSAPVQTNPAPPPVPRPAPAPPVKPREERPEPETRDARRTPGNRDGKVAIPVESQAEREPRLSPREDQQEEEISFVDPPRPVSVPAAPYPEGAAGSGAKAKVVVSILVSAGGEVVEVGVKSILVEGGDREGLTPIFREAALNAARQARFEPARSDGRPVSYRGELTFSF